MASKLFYGQVIFLITVQPLFSLQIDLREGLEKNERYSTLNLTDSENTTCIKTFNDFNKLSKIECNFSTTYSQEKSFSNSFFNIKVEANNKSSRVTIIPKKNTILFSSDKDVSKLDFFYPRDEIEQAQHWVAVGFNGDKPPFIENKDLYNWKRINFPIHLNYKNSPIIGALDIDGHPIREESTGDVDIYMDLRDSYEKGQYRNVISLGSRILNDFPNTLFHPEIVLYQMRALFKLKGYQQIINLSKEYLKDYSGDGGVAEVLLYTAYVHSKLGFTSYAKYYFVRLFEEHKDSEFKNWGLIYYGDDRISGGKKAEAMKLYKDALYNTKDIEIATIAAYRLGQIYLEDLKIDDSEFYLSKIVEGNPQFLLNDINRNYKLAKDLSEHNKTKLSANMLRILLKDKKFTDLDDYETMLKDLGVWLDMSGQVEDAYTEYERYLKIYDYGMFDKLVRDNKDKLLFFRDEKNETVRLNNYDYLVEQYGHDSDIGKQAVYEKSKVLYDQKDFNTVLSMENDLNNSSSIFPDSLNVLKNSALGLAKNNLKNSNCNEAIILVKKFELKLDQSEDEQLYNCSMENSQYKIAEEITKRRIAQSEDTLKWLYRYSQVLINSGKYREFLKISDEVISMAKIEKNSNYNEIYYDRYKAFDMLQDNDKVLDSVATIDKLFKDSYKNLQSFKTAVDIAKNKKDDLLIEKYGKKVLAIQDRLNSFVETPEIELLITTSLQHQNKFSEVIQVLENLLKRDLSNDIKSRVYYEMGSAYNNLKNIQKAKESFQKSFELSPNNSWGRLSSDFLKLL